MFTRGSRCQSVEPSVDKRKQSVHRCKQMSTSVTKCDQVESVNGCKQVPTSGWNKCQRVPDEGHQAFTNLCPQIHRCRHGVRLRSRGVQVGTWSPPPPYSPSSDLQTYAHGEQQIFGHHSGASHIIAARWVPRERRLCVCRTSFCFLFTYPKQDLTALFHAADVEVQNSADSPTPPPPPGQGTAANE